MDDVTFIVKTFLRPDCVSRLIASIFDHYPRAAILVADDSPAAIVRDDVRVYGLPFDSGISRGRNHLLDRVETEYLVLMDDDHVCTGQTRIERLVEPIAAGELDLVGGYVESAAGRQEWEGLLELDGDTLTFRRGSRGAVGGVRIVDACHNFFAARAAAVRRVRWDDELKVNEHLDFFLRAKGRIRVGVDPTVRAFHAPGGSPEYARFRGRAAHYRALFMRRNGIRCLVNELYPAGSLSLEAGR